MRVMGSRFLTRLTVLLLGSSRPKRDLDGGGEILPDERYAKVTLWTISLHTTTDLTGAQEMISGLLPMGRESCSLIDYGRQCPLDLLAHRGWCPKVSLLTTPHGRMVLRNRSPNGTD